MSDPMDVAAIREAYGLSQRQLAKALSCSQQSVVRWESGDHGPTGLYRAVLQAMAAAATQADERTLRVNGAVISTLGIGEFITMRIERMVP